MKSWLIPMAAGFGAGILSAWGVGGGTLLLLVMTLILGVPQQQAAAVNLLYFLPCAACALTSGNSSSAEKQHSTARSGKRSLIFMPSPDLPDESMRGASRTCPPGTGKSARKGA